MSRVYRFRLEDGVTIPGRNSMKGEYRRGVAHVSDITLSSNFISMTYTAREETRTLIFPLHNIRWLELENEESKSTAQPVQGSDRPSKRSQKP